MPELEPESARQYCYRCMRVQAACLCQILTGCNNRTELHILQHRKERRHAFGTVRLLKIGLQNCIVHDLHNERGDVYPLPSGFPLDAGVLYPGEGSLDLSTLAPEQLPGKLVVIDGTWSQAHRIYRDNPWLRGLQRYSLSPSAPSRYRIRKEPSAECLSTLESTVMALQMIEPDTPGIGELSRAFDVMNDQQVERMQARRGGPRRFKKDRPRPMRAVPHALWAEPERIVLVYAESALPLTHRNSNIRELVQWSALRLTEPKHIFDSIVRSSESIPNCFLEDLGWQHSELERAEPLATTQARFQGFLRKGDVIVAWNKGSLRLGMHHKVVDEGIVLKDIYGNTTQRNFGTLDDVVKFDNLRPIAKPAIAGRGAQRLANAHAAALSIGQWARNRQGIA